jgi:hypothetical protein
MSKNNQFENDVVAFRFNNVAMPAYGSNLTLNLHTADPGETGNSSTNVCTYTGYAPVNVSRDASGWLVNGNRAENVALIQFPKCTGPADDETATHLSITGTGDGGFASGALASQLRITNNVQPQLPIAAVVYLED